MKIYFISLLLYLMPFLTVWGQQAYNSNNDLLPLKSAAPKGIGPMSLPYLHHIPVGSAYVYDSEQPDLFVVGRNKVQGLFLFKWLKNDASGVPIFAEPIEIESSVISSGDIFQTADKKIHALWIQNKQLVHMIFNKKELAFEKQGEFSLDKLPSSVISIGAKENSDKSIDLVFELTGYTKPAKYESANASIDSWRPYDEAGINSLSTRYTYLYAGTLSKLSKQGEIINLRQASASNKEVYSGMQQISPIDLSGNGKNAWIVGGRLGIMSYYTAKSNDKGHQFDRKYIVDESGNILRHPSVNAAVCTYKKGDNVTHFVAGGESALYYYHFTGKYSQNGSPIFKKPTPLLQVNADLYTGTLPTPTVVDWDGDGMLDMIVGNSEGHILFFKNVGTNDLPAFLPGEMLQAGGRDIQIQAGYSGSVQGTPEARWGYVTPTVVDWTGDGLLDIIIGDITGNYAIYINKGTKNNAMLDAAQPLYCDGLELHGMWRSRAAVGLFGEQTLIAIVDEEDHFHLYEKIDDYNVADLGKIPLVDGSNILTSADPAGGTGRCKLDFFDYDGDGKLDLIIGTGRRAAIPNMETGYPLPILGKKTMGTPLFMKNVSKDGQLMFAHPKPFKHPQAGLVQPGGPHESGAVGTILGGGNRKNLLVGNETGRLYLLQGNKLELMEREEVEPYKNTPNPFPGFPHFGNQK